MSEPSDGMLSGFNRHGDSAYVAHFSASECGVLVNLVEQIIELLGERKDRDSSDPLAAMIGITDHDSPPDDGVLLRLLPNAYADQVDASEFRRYTESALRTKKHSHAISVRIDVKSSPDGCIEIDRTGADAWLGAMNDIRLALGVRLELQGRTNEDLENLTAEDPMLAVYAVYRWLGWLQESLLRALMDGDL